MSGVEVNRAPRKKISKIKQTRRMVILMTAFVCVALGVLTAWHVSWDRAEALRQHTVEMENLAKALNGQAESTIREAHTVLTGLITDLNAGGASPEHLKDLDRIARAQLPLLGEIDGFFISDESGRYLLNTRHFDPLMNNSDRDYFQYHRDNRSPELYIGKPLLSKTSGQWIITLSMRVAGPNNEFKGVALATLNVQRLVAVYRGLGLGDEGVISLAKLDGTVLARTQANASVSDKNISESPMLRMANDGATSGAATFNAIIDGVLRIYGFNASNEYPILVAVAVSQNEALAAWRSRATAFYLFAGAVELTIIAFGFVILRALSVQARMERDLHRTYASLAEANRALEVIASEDSLTGLATRRRMDESFVAAFERAGDAGESLGFILVDVDYFKLFNDTHGHPAGDRALIELAGVLRGVIRRDIDIAARYGGEEFAIVLPGADLDEAAGIAEKVRQEVERRNLHHPSVPEGKVTISVGVCAGVPGRCYAATIDMVAAAYGALYSAKRLGRNQAALAH